MRRSRLRKTQRIEGEVVSINDEGGFAFLVAGETEYFCHATQLPEGMDLGDLVVGEKLSFVGSRGPKGWRALEVRKPNAGSK